MELRFSDYSLPEVIDFNYEELKTELANKCEVYKAMVYTADGIKDAKADRANLNKLKKALNDERIAREKDYMVPFNKFKDKVNELIKIIDEPVAIIDSQVKEYEAMQKEAKRAEIQKIWDAWEKPDGIELEKIFGDKWLNSSYTIESVKADIDLACGNYIANMSVLEKLPEFSFEAMEVYKSTYNLQSAIAEANRLSEIARRKAEAQKIVVNEAPKEVVEEVKIAKIEPSEDKPTWLYYQLNLTESTRGELEMWCRLHNIEFRRI